MERSKRFSITSWVCAAIAVAMSAGAYADEVCRFVGEAGGAWEDASNWEGGVVPTAADAVVLDGVSVVATEAVEVGSLVIQNGSLSIANPDYEHIGLTVSGALEILRDGVLTMTAGRCTEDPSVYGNVYNQANVLSAQTFHIGNRGMFVPVSEFFTGVPVVVRVEDFVLDYSGVVDSTSKGYGWLPEADFEEMPVGTKKDNNGITYAPGHGSNYGAAASYGGRAWGATYGYLYAPWMAGSPGGLYNGVNYYNNGRASGSIAGGGAIVIRATGRAVLAGDIKTDAYARFYNGASGGSIWLIANEYTIYSSANLSAMGAAMWAYASGGGGGRVSVAAGITDAEMDALAAGASPADLELAGGPTLDFVRVQVSRKGSDGRALDPSLDVDTSVRAGTKSHVYDSAEAVIVRTEMRNLEGRICAEGCLIERVGGVQIDVEAINGVEGRSFAGGAWELRDGEDVVIASGTGDVATIPATAEGELTLAWQVEEQFEEPVAEVAVVDPVTKQWSGATGGAWEDAGNWAPAGVPRYGDDVLIPAGAYVKAAGVVKAGTLTVEAGAVLAIGGMGQNVLEQSAAEGECFGMKVAGDLIVEGDLSVGGRDGCAPIEAEVGGDLIVRGEGRMAVYATRPDWIFFKKYRYENVYADATTVDVGGVIRVEDRGVIYPDSDYLVGTSVRFRASAVVVEEGAAFDADMRGYGVMAYGKEGPTDATLMQTERLSDSFLTFSRGVSFGDRIDNKFASGYGGYSFHSDTNLGSQYRGQPYGYAAAPFLPGSPDGYGNESSTRGGGVIWIECAGQFTLEGTLRANGGSYLYPGSGISRKSRTSTGGGIWVVAKNFSYCGKSRVSADAGTLPSVANAYPSAGGRIAIVLGNVTADEIAILAEGEVPEGLDVGEGGFACAVTAQGGEGYEISANRPCKSDDGTIRKLDGERTGRVISITNNRNVKTENVVFGEIDATGKTAASYQCEPFAYSEDGSERYDFEGWKVVDEGGTTIAQGETLVADFVPAAEGVTHLEWQWAEVPSKMTEVTLSSGCGGSVTVNGAPYAETVEFFGNVGDVIVAVPGVGYEFLYWLGDVYKGTEKAATIVLTDAESRSFRPIFRPIAEPATRQWGGGVGDWTDPAMWEGGVIPGLADAVVIESGACFASNYVEAASIRLGGTAKLYVAAVPKASSLTKSISEIRGDYRGNNEPAEMFLPIASKVIEEVRIQLTGDLVLRGSSEFVFGAQEQEANSFLEVRNFVMGGSSKALIVAGPLGGAYNFGTGGGFVNVAGEMTICDTAALYPACEGYTGASVVFRVEGDFELGAEASINADGMGYLWYEFRSPQTLTPSVSNEYANSPAHGGKGLTGAAQTYDFELAPVQPGSCMTTPYQRILAQSEAGGGVIRVHAKNVRMAGVCTAKATHRGQYHSAGSGGTIWITAERRLEVASGVVLDVSGNESMYGFGGSGRISLGRKVSAAELAALEADGGDVPVGVSGKPIAVVQKAAFLEEYPGVEVVTLPSGAAEKHEGTFVFLNGGDFKSTVFMVR